MSNREKAYAYFNISKLAGEISDLAEGGEYIPWVHFVPKIKEKITELNKILDNKDLGS